jgi:hypothetical protein
MGPSYEKLLSQYIEELRATKAPVNAWWSRLVAAQLAKTPNKVEAAAELTRRWPGGPATHPRVVAVVRKYFLACDRLNQQVNLRVAESQRGATAHTTNGTREESTEEEEDRPISPAVFVGEMLASAKTDDLLKIVAKFSYWPIGTAANGTNI